MGDAQKKQLSFLSGGKHGWSVLWSSLKFMNTFQKKFISSTKAFQRTVSDLAYPKDNFLSSWPKGHTFHGNEGEKNGMIKGKNKVLDLDLCID